VQIEGFESRAFFFEGERFEMRAHPGTVVNQGWAMRQQLMSFAPSALALLLVCEQTLPPQRYLSFIPLKLFEVNHLGSIDGCPASFLPIASPQGHPDALSFRRNFLWAWAETSW
jgi:hypothetical protein